MNINLDNYREHEILPGKFLKIGVPLQNKPKKSSNCARFMLILLPIFMII